jgi:hypothetical protein
MKKAFSFERPARSKTGIILRIHSFCSRRNQYAKRSSNPKAAARNAATLTAQELEDVWRRACVPIKSTNIIADKILNIYELLDFVRKPSRKTRAPYPEKVSGISFLIIKSLSKY